MKKIGLAIFLALTLVSAVVLADKDYWPVAQKALHDAQDMSLSNPASLPKGFESYTFGCTMPVMQQPGKDVVWNVVNFEVQTSGDWPNTVNFTKLVVITVDRKGRTTRNECSLEVPGKYSLVFLPKVK